MVLKIVCFILLSLFEIIVGKELTAFSIISR